MTFRELHRNVQIRLVQNFIGNMIGSMVFPFIAIYFAEAIGPSLTGLLLVLNIVITVISGAYGGHFADKYGRKRVKVWAECVRVLMFVIVTLANSPWYHSAMLTCISMLVIGFCDGLSGPASEAMLIDVTTSAARSVVYSIDYWSNNLGLVIGGVVGGYLFHSYKFALFGSMTLFLIASLIVLFLWVTETLPASDALQSTARGETKVKTKSMSATYKVVFKNRVFMLFLVAGLFCGSLENITNNYGRVRLDESIVTPHTILSIGHYALTADGLQLFAFLQAMNALIVVLFSAVVRKWIHRFGNRRALLTGITCSLIGYGVILVNNWPLLLGVSMIVATVGEILWVPVRQTILADLAPADNRGVFMAVAGLTGVGGNMIGGFSITLGAFVTPWVMLIGFACIGLLSLWMYNRTLCQITPHVVSAANDVSL